MESNLDPNNTQGIDGPIEDELTEEEFGELSVRARINARNPNRHLMCLGQLNIC